MTEYNRASRCLPKKEAEREMHAIAETLTAMGRPERCCVRKYGKGWAVFVRVPPEDEDAA